MKVRKEKNKRLQINISSLEISIGKSLQELRCIKFEKNTNHPSNSKQKKEDMQTVYDISLFK